MPMPEVLTIADIESRYPDEWILVGDPQVDAHLRVTRGIVLAHSMDRDEVYRRAAALRPKHSAFLYTGRIPERTAVVL